ncbi:lytic transglycosylase domain-containing protein [Spirosoma sp. BT702]|uniref:Lytic transglycosylase domain-containing protein n=1 Tax=Spirosoma profusum TaxID=2771354 RepID=A0A926XVN7_9BACT|nr:lytic transglycosylase domain-containing protein [Spirosoma profusum]MBD2700606.1 lytic transglycosylase domain-containing protein [Spirosoma profusum]
MAAFKPGLTPPFWAADTSRLLPLSNGLNSPELLVVDSSRRVFPIYFCGEEVPVGEPRVARRWVQTLRTYGAEPEFLIDLRSKASEFFTIIDPILRKYKIPRDFRFMPLAESALDNRSISRKGAVGYWQIMPGTARDLGLKVNGDVDERRNLEKSTIAVCRHLHQLYRDLGSWTLVAAAYNGGITHVRHKMDQQGHSNYYRLRLHKETSHYLFRILAFKELLSNPRQYSLLLRSETIAELTKPLPSWHKPLALPKKIKDAPIVELVDEDYVERTWGPRPNTALTHTPSDSEQLIADAALTKASPDAPTAALEKQEPRFPVKQLMMSLMVLRFRRPRFLQFKKGEGIRPLHFWDWI